jgi:hypothetical protein
MGLSKISIGLPIQIDFDDQKENTNLTKNME